MIPYAIALQKQLDAHAYATSSRAQRQYPTDRNSASTVATLATVTTQYASPFYWTPEFSRLLAATAPDLPLAWTFRPESLPVDYGFCWFAEPLRLPPDLLGVGQAALPCVALGWCALMDGGAGPIIPIHGVPPPRDGDQFSVVYFCDPGDGTCLPHMAFSWRVGESFGASRERARRELVPDGLVPRMQDNLLARLSFFAAALAFMEQRIAVVSREPVDRATRRRIPSAAPIEPLVRVVALRRPATPRPRDAGTADVDWACRWTVTGHWRHQFYPSENTHKTIFIDAYVKGPPDRPMKAPRTTLFAVIR